MVMDDGKNVGYLLFLPDQIPIFFCPIGFLFLLKASGTLFAASFGRFQPRGVGEPPTYF